MKKQLKTNRIISRLTKKAARNDFPEAAIGALQIFCDTVNAAAKEAQAARKAFESTGATYSFSNVLDQFKGNWTPSNLTGQFEDPVAVQQDGINSDEELEALKNMVKALDKYRNAIVNLYNTWTSAGNKLADSAYADIDWNQVSR